RRRCGGRRRATGTWRTNVSRSRLTPRAPGRMPICIASKAICRTRAAGTAAPVRRRRRLPWRKSGRRLRAPCSRPLKLVSYDEAVSVARVHRRDTMIDRLRDWGKLIAIAALMVILHPQVSVAIDAEKRADIVALLKGMGTFTNMDKMIGILVPAMIDDFKK